MAKSPRQKPPFDYWLWLVIFGLIVIAGIFGLLGPIPFTPSAARRDAQHHPTERPMPVRPA